VVHDDPVVVIGDLGFVAEPGRLAEPSFGDRPGVGVVQADSPGCPVRGDPGQPLAGLGGDPPGGLQQPGQAIDRAAQPASPPASRGIAATGRSQARGLAQCPAQCPARVRQQHTEAAEDPITLNYMALRLAD
jgi:hypothetical protein